MQLKYIPIIKPVAKRRNKVTWEQSLMTSEANDEDDDEGDDEDEDDASECSTPPLKRKFRKEQSSSTKSSVSSEASCDTGLVDEAMNQTHRYSNLIYTQMLDRLEDHENDDSGITADDELERDMLINQMGAKVTGYYRNMVAGKLTTRSNIMERTQKELDDAYEVLGRVIRQTEKNMELEPIRREVQNLRKHTKMIVVAAERLGYSQSEAEYIDQLEQVVKVIDILNSQHDQAMCELHKLRLANARLCSLAGSDTYHYQCRPSKQEITHRYHCELPRTDDSETLYYPRKKTSLRSPLEAKTSKREQLSFQRQVRECVKQSESSGTATGNDVFTRPEANRDNSCIALKRLENIDQIVKSVPQDAQPYSQNAQSYSQNAPPYSQDVQPYNQDIQSHRQVEEKGTSTNGFDGSDGLPIHYRTGRTPKDSEKSEDKVKSSKEQDPFSWMKFLFYCGAACILLAFILGLLCRILSFLDSSGESCPHSSIGNIDSRHCGILSFFEECPAGKLMNTLFYSKSTTDFNVKQVQPQFSDN